MSKPKKRKLEIKNLEEALLNLPEEERDEARKEILNMFENMDPENPPGEKVEHLPKTTSTCPSCGGGLVLKSTVTLPEETKPVQILDCPKCDKAFTRDVSN